MKPTLEELKEQLNSLTEQIKKYESGERFEIGRWYKNVGGCGSHPYWFYYKEGGSGMYGFNNDMNWSCNLSCGDSDLGVYYRPATTSEVEAALIAEAKKRIKHQSKYKSVREVLDGDEYDGRTATGSYGINGTMGLSFSYNEKTDTLYNMGFGLYVIYEQGQWATIIPQEEKIEIGNREVIIDKDNDLINVGCKTIYQIELQQISDLMRRCDFDTIQLDDHSPVSLKTINAILKKL